MIEWLEQEQFWEYFELEYRLNNRYLNDIAYFYCTLDNIANLAEIEPVDTPADEADFPGPVLRWYSRINGDLVLVTFHLHETPFVNLEFEDDVESKVLENVFSEFKKYGLEANST